MAVDLRGAPWINSNLLTAMTFHIRDDPRKSAQINLWLTQSASDRPAGLIKTGRASFTRKSRVRSLTRLSIWQGFSTLLKSTVASTDLSQFPPQNPGRVALPPRAISCLQQNFTAFSHMIVARRLRKMRKK